MLGRIKLVSRILVFCLLFFFILSCNQGIVVGEDEEDPSGDLFPADVGRERYLEIEPRGRVSRCGTAGGRRFRGNVAVTFAPGARAGVVGL